MERGQHPNDAWPKDGWQVVFDTQGRFSVWPQDRPAPSGWQANGYAGSREACLAEIGRAWTDPRPVALRTAMASGANF